VYADERVGFLSRRRRGKNVCLTGFQWNGGIVKVSGRGGLEHEEHTMTEQPSRTMGNMWRTSKLPTRKTESRYNQYKMELGAQNI